MYGLSASTTWDEIMTDNVEMAAEDYDAKISISSNYPERSGFPLRTSHVISSLLGGINDMSTRSKYFGLAILITHENQEIGTIFISNKYSENPSLRLTTSQDETRNVKPRALNAPDFSGEIMDPNNPRLKITYDIDGGRITFREAFLMFLDGIATAAEPGKRVPCDSFYALDPGAHAVFHIGQGSSTRQSLSYDFIIRILFLLWIEGISDKKGFYQMSLQVFFDGQQMGQGSITRLSIPIGDSVVDNATG